MVSFEKNPLYNQPHLQGEMPSLDTTEAKKADETQKPTASKSKNIFASIRQNPLVIRFTAIAARAIPVTNKPTLCTKLLGEITKPNSSFTKANALVDTLRNEDPNWKSTLKNNISSLDKRALSDRIDSLSVAKLKGHDREFVQEMLACLKRESTTHSVQFPQELELLLTDMQENDKNRNTQLTELSKGAVNTVYKCEIDGKEYVFKPDPSMLKITKKLQERLFGTAVASGIPPGNESHLAHRSVASAFVAKMLNPNSPISVDTKFAVINGQRGILMDMAEGKSPTVSSREVEEVPQTTLTPAVRELMQANNLKALAGLYEADFIEIKDDKLYKGTTTFSSGFDPANATSAEGLVDLHIMDIITGQCDRHPGNYKVKDGQIKAIDNDCSFGVNALPEKGDVKSQRALKGFIPNNGSLMLRMPPVISQKQREQITNLYENRQSLKEGLRANLSEKEVEATLVRLEKLYRHINSSDCYLLQEGENFLSENAINRLDPNNSYWARELMVLKPDQTGGWNNLRKSYRQSAALPNPQ